MAVIHLAMIISPQGLVIGVVTRIASLGG
jgi:hypothetical protein